jgi:hypothetical protein
MGDDEIQAGVLERRRRAERKIDHLAFSVI